MGISSEIVETTVTTISKRLRIAAWVAGFLVIGGCLSLAIFSYELRDAFFPQYLYIHLIIIIPGFISFMTFGIMEWIKKDGSNKRKHVENMKILEIKEILAKNGNEVTF